MSEVLFLAHRVPFPPDRGDRIRSSNLLKRIAALAPVHVGCLGDGTANLVGERELAALARSHCIARRGPLPLAGARAVLRASPVSVEAFASTTLSAYVADVLARRPISAIFVFSGQMAQYVPARFNGRVIMDFVDVDSAKFEAYAAAARQPMRTIWQRESRRLRAFEERTARRANTCLFVTPEERALFVSRLSEPLHARVEVLANGIDTAFHDPARVDPLPLEGGPQIAFTGQMDYPPNVEAATRFAASVMPGLLAAFPDARFNIVGRAPVAAVRVLDGKGGCRVTGEVPDVRHWLAAADLVVAPLSIARGIQNKVLEAMAMARPVLLTTPAATGIAATDGRDFVIADDPGVMAQAAIGLLRHRGRAAQVGAAARRFVVEHCGWDAVLQPLARHLGLTHRARRDAA